MTTPAQPQGGALAGYDGSPAAGTAIEVGAHLLPGMAVRVVHLWCPPFPTPELRRRFARGAASLDELSESLEQEAAAEAARIAEEGAALARSAGWEAEALTHRTLGGEGFELARLAEKLRPAVVVVGARGLSGVRAMLGSVSDMVVHYSPVPVLVVPHPPTAGAASGPVVVGHDGSEGAQGAQAAAAALFEGRELILATVGSDDVGAVEPVGGAPETVVLDAGIGLVSARDTAEALGAFAAERDAALVVVGSRGRSAARELLLGSVAMAVLHDARGPVLVVPPTG